ncbi:MAG: Ig-like domain-containing protein, partial [Christensenellaceae bacterium]|nr:Ig-like domain-containing protein [Christensenellaceae bacterium]
MIKTKKLIAFILAFTMIIGLMPTAAFAAVDDHSIVRVKISIGSVKQQALTIDGNYYIEESKSTELYRQSYTVSIENNALTLKDPLGETVLSGKSSITFIQCADTTGNNYMTVGSYHYKGNMKFTIVSGNLQLVNHVYIEDYIPGVLVGEIGDYFPIEVQKSQAIIARTYAVTHMSDSGTFDLYDTSRSQVYKGYNASWTNCIAGAEATAKQLLYCDSELVDVYYTNSNGGYVECYQHAWYPRAVEPYDIVREDTWDRDNAKSPKESLKIYKDLSANSLATNLSNYLKDLVASKADSERADVTLVSIDKIEPKTIASDHTSMPAEKCSAHGAEKYANHSEFLSVCPNYTGFAVTLKAKISGTTKSYTVEMDATKLKVDGTYEVYSKTNLRLFRLEETDSYYTLSQVRSGHGVGFSQHGAQQMAKSGWTYEQMIDFYYPNCEIKEGNITAPKLENKKTNSAVIAKPELAAVGTSTGNVNVRSGAGEEYTKLGTLKTGSVVEIVEKNVVSGWHKIWYNGQIAYVSADYVTIDEDGMKVIAEGIVTGSDVKVRRGPGTDFDQLTLASKNSKIYIIEKNAKSGWHRVLYNDIYGYMSSSYISIDNESITVTGVSLDQTQATMSIGSSITLTASVLPEDAAKNTVTWKTTNEDALQLTVGENNTCTVRAIAAGSAAVVVTTDEGGYTASCVITVDPDPVAVSGITLSNANLALYVGQEYELTAEVLPEDATNKTHTWASSNEKVVTVEEDVNGGCTVTALAVGSATITATTEDGEFKASCVVTVEDRGIIPAGIVAVGTVTGEVNIREKATTSSTKLDEVAAGAVLEIKDTDPADGWYMINWNGKDAYVSADFVRIDKDGMKIIAEGTVTGSDVKLRRGPSTSYDILTLASKNSTIYIIEENTKSGWHRVLYNDMFGYMSSSYIKISETTAAVTGVSLDMAEKTLKVGESFTLTATILPENAVNKAVSWASSDSAAVKVENGKVTALKAGTATITVTTTDGGFTASCKVTVEEETVAVTSITLNETKKTLTVGESFTLTATVLPENATDKTIEWLTSNEDVAVVENGKVTALKAGSAMIKAATPDGKIYAVCDITVEEKAAVKVTGVSLDVSEKTLTEGESFTLTAAVSPTDAENKAVSWASSDPDAAKVENGKVTALKEGTATITVTTEDGSFTASCKVIVAAKEVEPDGSIIAVGTTTGNVNIREKPTTTNSKKLGVGTKGSVVEITNLKAADGWYEINWNGGKAYVSADYVKIDKDGMTVTAKGTVTGSDVKLRRGPSTSYDQLLLASKNSAIEIIKQNAASGWHRVCYNGTYGYMSSKYIKITEENPGGNTGGDTEDKAVTAVALDVSEKTLTEGESFSLTATVSPSDAADKTVSWITSDDGVATVSGGKVTAVKEGTATITVKTKDGGFTASCKVTVTAKETETQPDGDIIAVGTTTGNVNIREKPTTTDSKKLGVGTKGSVVEITNLKAADGWYEINWNGGKAYVSADY